MNSNQNQLMQIYSARVNILEILNQVYSYDVSEYEGFSTNEVDTMISMNQLDMLLTKTRGEDGTPIHKTYIKFVLKDVNSKNNVMKLNQIIEDLYVLTDTLSKSDCLVVVIEGEPNDAMITHLNYIYQNDGIFIVVHNIKRLQFNILNHDLVPKVEILNETDVDTMKSTFQVNNLTQLPEISRYDPQALAICLRPGKVCRFYRKSPTALETEYYRYCI
jgi:DNA-directed RNA polymerase subunit H|tara:strand:+ start:760 stop:1413 length:654 start_codon:yes stop_codon:yes gene_type:complete